MEKMDTKFQKELRQALPPVPDLFKAAMEETLSEIVAQETGACKAERSRRVRPGTSRVSQEAGQTESPKRPVVKHSHRKPAQASSS